MRPLLPAISAVALLGAFGSEAGAAACGYRAPNGAVPGTLTAGPAPCTPAANSRPIVGTQRPADARRPRERSNTTIHIGGSVGADTRVGR